LTISFSTAQVIGSELLSRRIHFVTKAQTQSGVEWDVLSDILIDPPINVSNVRTGHINDVKGLENEVLP
jgi:hypothetical protein